MYIISAIFVIINYTDNSALYCTSEDWFESWKDATPFCIITGKIIEWIISSDYDSNCNVSCYNTAGAVYYYVLLQLAVFWFCNVSVLFWKIRFPFHSRSFQVTNRVKYVHVTAIALGILVPFIPIIATMSQSAHGKSAAGAAKDGLGFGIIRSPPIFCLGTNADTTFYSLVLPIIAILMVGMVMLITIFWIIHKVSTCIGGSIMSHSKDSCMSLCI